MGAGDETPSRSQDAAVPPRMIKAGHIPRHVRDHCILVGQLNGTHNHTML